MADLRVNVSPLIPLTFAVAGDSGGYNPADATTYYSGAFQTSDPTAGETGITLNVPFNCIVRAATIQTVVAGTLGSGESATVFVRVNGTTNTNLSTAITYAAASTIFNITGLSLSLSKGDRLQFGRTMPTWVTNPTTVLEQLTLLVEPN